MFTEKDENLIEGHICEIKLQQSQESNTSKIVKRSAEILIDNALSVPFLKGLKLMHQVEKPEEICAWLMQE